MLPERIELPDAVLRPFRTSDADALARAVGESLEHLRPWMPWANNGSAEPDFQRRRLVAVVQQWNRGDEYQYGLFDPEEARVLGSFGLMTATRPQQPGDRLLGTRATRPVAVTRPVPRPRSRMSRSPCAACGRSSSTRTRRTCGARRSRRGSGSSCCGSRPRTASRPARPDASRCGGARRRSAPTTGPHRRPRWARSVGADARRVFREELHDRRHPEPHRHVVDGEREHASIGDRELGKPRPDRGLDLGRDRITELDLDRERRMRFGRVDLPGTELARRRGPPPCG